ncbi:hypothetical protein ACFSL6_12905 [Paenibacillus thailandensis]|uniref:Uncharacterized protein n=1 Tax=Paenibacillus thailandensis TaxID=393250 RepID=A0ABW5R027_9BACL
MRIWVNAGNRKTVMLLIAMAAALLMSALFFSYQATDKTHFQSYASEMASGSDVHYAAPGKHLPAYKWMISVLPAGAALLLLGLPAKRLPANSPASLRSFIPLRLMALFLMPIKRTSLYETGPLFS